MGWQARLPKDQKECFEKSCPKCAGTGVRGNWVYMDGLPTNPTPRKCACILKIEKEAELDKRRDEADKRLVEGLIKEENASVAE